MTPKQKGPLIAFLALLPGALIGALILIAIYPLMVFAAWAMKTEDK